MFEKIGKNRGYKKLDLMIEIDDKKHRKIYVGKPDHLIYLKSFCGEFDFKKFLVEACILRMMADKSSLDRCREVYNKIYDSVLDIEKNHKTPDNDLL